MQIIKKISVILLAMIIFALSLPTATIFAADADMRYGRTKLNATEQKIYDKLVTGFSNGVPSQIEIDKSWNVSTDQAYKAFDMFYSDYPEYFWVENGNYSLSTLDNKVVTFIPKYTFSNIDSAKTSYNAKVNELTKGLNGKSDYEKAKILHDRLIDNTQYVAAENNQNAYGALVGGKAVCNGYARAYQHMMHKVGIPAWYVKGTSYNPTTGESVSHAWNLVKLDGSWYYTDVTWDDQDENTFYAYFNITTQQLSEDHIIDDLYKPLVPKATATSANYFVKENKVFTSYDKSKLANLIKNAPKHSVQIYVSGNKNDFDTKFMDNIQALFTETEASGGSYYSCGRARIITFAIPEKGHTHKVKTTVKQENATCLANGKKAYYICDCGAKFFDSECTNPIIKESDLTIPATSHKPSGWKNDATNHFKICTDCSNQIANTRSLHIDNNKDNKCDTCGYNLPIVSKPNTSSTTSSKPSSSQSQSSTSSKPNKKPTASSSTSSIDSGTSSSSNTTSESGNTEETVSNENISENNSSVNEVSSNHKTKENKKEKSLNFKKLISKIFSNMLLIITAVVVAAGAIVAIIIIIKKKK